MKITVQNNRIIAHDIDLGARFTDIHADIIVDKIGRTKILAEKIQFYCDLDSIGNDILAAINDPIDKDENYGMRGLIIERASNRYFLDIPLVLTWQASGLLPSEDENTHLYA